MKRINIETGKFENDFQQFRKACLEVVDEDIEICYNNSILKHNFDYKNKVLKTYKYHATKHEGAISRIESEIFDIFSVMTKGGINTRVGTKEVFNQAHDYDVEYMEGDNMIGLKNVKVKTMGRQLYTNSYVVDCVECGRRTFSSVKTGFFTKCPRCANENHEAPQIKMSELLDMCEVTAGEEEGVINLKADGINIELELDKAQKETMSKIATHDLKQKLQTLYVMDNKSIDSNKPAEAPRPVSVSTSAPKKTTTRKAKSKITDEDLTFVLNQIRVNFANKSFKSRDLAPKVADRLTARQLPSRLTQLVNKGVLNADNASPKNYTLIQEV